MSMQYSQQVMSQEEQLNTELGYGFVPESQQRGTIPSMPQAPPSENLGSAPEEPLLSHIKSGQQASRYSNYDDDDPTNGEENRQAGKWVRHVLTCCAVCHIVALLLFIILLIGAAVGMAFVDDIEYRGMKHFIRESMPITSVGQNAGTTTSAIDLINDDTLEKRLQASTNDDFKSEILPILQEHKNAKNGQSFLETTVPGVSSSFEVDFEGNMNMLHMDMVGAALEGPTPTTPNSTPASANFFELVAGGAGGGGGGGKPGAGKPPAGGLLGENGAKDSLQGLEDTAKMFENLANKEGDGWAAFAGKHIGAATYLLGFFEGREDHPAVLFSGDVHQGMMSVFGGRTSKLAGALELMRLGKVDSAQWQRVLDGELQAEDLLNVAARGAAGSFLQLASTGTQAGGPFLEPEGGEGEELEMEDMEVLHMGLEKKQENGLTSFLEAGPPAPPGGPLKPPQPATPRTPQPPAGKRIRKIRDLKDRDWSKDPVLKEFQPEYIGKPFALNIVTVVFLFIASVGLCHLACCKCCACGTSRVRFGKGLFPAIVLWLVVASEIVIFSVRCCYPDAVQVFPAIIGDHVFKVFERELNHLEQDLEIRNTHEVESHTQAIVLGLSRMNRLALGQIKFATHPLPTRLNVQPKTRLRAARIVYSMLPHNDAVDKVFMAMLKDQNNEVELLGDLMGDSDLLPSASRAGLKAGAEGAIPYQTQKELDDLIGKDTQTKILGPLRRILKAAEQGIVNWKEGGTPVGMQVGLWNFEIGFIISTILTIIFLILGMALYGQWNPLA